MLNLDIRCHKGYHENFNTGLVDNHPSPIPMVYCSMSESQKLTQPKNLCSQLANRMDSNGLFIQLLCSENQYNISIVSSNTVWYSEVPHEKFELVCKPVAEFKNSNT